MDEQNRVIHKESSLYQLGVQEMIGLGESGLSEYEDAEFVDVRTGKIHMSTHLVVERDLQWSSDGERVFFNGFLYDLLGEEEDPFFVVMDVKNKAYLHVYQGYAEYPRWNTFETDAIFDNVLEESRDTFAFLDRESRRFDLERNLPVIHLENEQVVEADGRQYVGQSISPDYSHMVRFYKVRDRQNDNFEVLFWVYRRKDEWWLPLRWAMSYSMVNGVDGFGWVDGATILYSVSGSRRSCLNVLSSLGFLS